MIRNLAVSVCLFAVSVAVVAQSPFTPPAASASAVAGINFQSAQPLDALHARYSTCDLHDICGDTPVHKPNLCSTDPSRNSVILRFSNGVVFYDAKMAIDADGSQLSKLRGGTDLPETAWHYPTPPHSSVDAEHVPYIVLPREFVSKTFAGLLPQVSISIGDIAAVVFNGQVRYALVADTGPPCKIGEGSMKLHDELGHPACTQLGPDGLCIKEAHSGISANVLYFIFPGSGKSISKGLSPDNINQVLAEEGPKLMQSLTGASK